MSNIERSPEWIYAHFTPDGDGIATPTRVGSRVVEPMPYEVEYVRADIHQGAVKALREVTDWLEEYIHREYVSDVEAKQAAEAVGRGRAHLPASRGQ